MRKLSDSQQGDLDATVTREEVKLAIFSIANGKAPGPDGYSAAFSKNNWDIVGGEVTDAVLEFF